MLWLLPGILPRKIHLNLQRHKISVVNYLIFKRLFDFYCSLLALLILSPIFLIIYILLFIANKGQVFFTQERPGKNEKIFKVIKFKTMSDARNSSGQLLPDAERLTVVGKLVRSLSIDELPQLINVLKGDMSLVGPRPLLPKYLPLYNEVQKKRHNVRPGITGWAQVNGRNAISWSQKFNYDVWYVNNVSFLLDIKIILLTLKKVVMREDINSNNSTTMLPFTGNN
ncbi:MAG TPA: sugar transferase [Ferruginibacter sp.]|nr:sugar transferase [Ferruginibacter sp.]HMP19630.1 sugar transferase [Ferruginibacter sp.]